MNINIQFQIECLATELVEMLMQKYGWDMKTALDVLLSNTCNYSKYRFFAIFSGCSLIGHSH